MEILVVIPTKREFDLFLASCKAHALQIENLTIGKLPAVKIIDIGITLSHGGLGKVQFAIHTQHLLDAYSGWSLVICLGTAGALIKGLSVGDIVVATETIEHDFHDKSGKSLLPRFSGAETVLSELQSLTSDNNSFQVHFAPVASGDEDVMDFDRREAIHKLTGAFAVAWEGAGGARACQFSNIPFVEMRGVTDFADNNAVSDFKTNMQSVMDNMAVFIISWLKKYLE
jgi:adenosylhomocysteine nucleosidase